MYQALLRWGLREGPWHEPLRAIPLGPHTYRLELNGGRSLIAKWGSPWEGVMLQAVQRLELAPRLLAAPRGAGSRPVLLLMEAAPGASPDWADAGALARMMRAIAELHRRTSRPDGTVLCHGDLHRANLLWDGRRATLLDWALARRARPLWDLARFWPWAPAAAPRQGGTGPTGALSPGCDLPIGEAALTALGVYHRAGPLAHLSWPEFQVQHRAAARALLLAERDRHLIAASKAPAGLRPWIEKQARLAAGALHQIDHPFTLIP